MTLEFLLVVEMLLRHFYLPFNNRINLALNDQHGTKMYE
jgi:hypothetical protein